MSRLSPKIKIMPHFRPVKAVEGGGGVEQRRQQILLDVSDFAPAALQAVKHILDIMLPDIVHFCPTSSFINFPTSCRKVITGHQRTGSTTADIFVRRPISGA